MIWKVVWRGLYDNNNVETRSIFNAVLDEGDVGSAAVDALEDWSQTMWDTIKGVIDDSFRISDIDYYTLRPSTADEWDLVETRGYGVTLKGTAGSVDVLPPATQGIVSARTTRARSRGRKFIPGMTEAGNSEGAPSSGVIDALTDFAAVWISEFTSGSVTFAPVIYSILHGALSIAGSLIKQQWGILRKREVGVGI